MRDQELPRQKQSEQTIAKVDSTNCNVQVALGVCNVWQLWAWLTRLLVDVTTSWRAKRTQTVGEPHKHWPTRQMCNDRLRHFEPGQRFNTIILTYLVWRIVKSRIDCSISAKKGSGLASSWSHELPTSPFHCEATARPCFFSAQLLIEVRAPYCWAEAVFFTYTGCAIMRWTPCWEQFS